MVSEKGAIKVDCPHCGERILIRKMRAGYGPFNGPAYDYLVAEEDEWVPALKEERREKNPWSKEEISALKNNLDKTISEMERKNLLPGRVYIEIHKQLRKMGYKYSQKEKKWNLETTVDI
jgi:hypothetical protein